MFHFPLPQLELESEGLRALSGIIPKRLMPVSILTWTKAINPIAFANKFNSIACSKL